MMFLIEAGRRCESGPGTFTFETRQGDDIFSRIESAVQEQKSGAVAGVKRRPNSPLPSIPYSANLVGVPTDTSPTLLNSSSNSRMMSDTVKTVNAGEPIYTDPASVVSFSKPMLSNAQDSPDSPEIVYADPLDAIRTPQPMITEQLPPVPPTIILRQSSEPVYSSPVNCACPPLDPDSCADSEPVYSEVSDDVPVAAVPLHDQQEAVYSEPYKAAYTGTDELESDDVRGEEIEDEAMDDPSALYSKVIKPPKISQISKPPKLSQTRRRLPHHQQPPPDVVYEDLGLI